MTELILFGGTTEGRALCERLDKKRVEALVCVATEYGEALLPRSDTIRVRTGRLAQPEMVSLFEVERPRLVIDATHPYAAEASGNIRAACEEAGIRHIRLVREAVTDSGCVLFSGLDELTAWLNRQCGTVFSTLGAKEAAALTAVTGYRERVWLRILPDVAGLAACLEAGFPARHLICMQGPFSRELNAAMFREAEADILLTKESGAAGGYPEKMEAARECGMTVAALARPKAENGFTLAQLTKQIEEGNL